MLNRKPIFIVAFVYGDSNIPQNLLRTHPDVCSPRDELNGTFARSRHLGESDGRDSRHIENDSQRVCRLGTGFESGAHIQATLGAFLCLA